MYILTYISIYVYMIIGLEKEKNLERTETCWFSVLILVIIT